MIRFALWIYQFSKCAAKQLYEETSYKESQIFKSKKIFLYFQVQCVGNLCCCVTSAVADVRKYRQMDHYGGDGAALLVGRAVTNPNLQHQQLSSSYISYISYIATVLHFNLNSALATFAISSNPLCWIADLRLFIHQQRHYYIFDVDIWLRQI